VRSWGICLFVPGLFHLKQCFSVPSRLPQVTGFCLFQWLNPFPSLCPFPAPLVSLFSGSWWVYLILSKVLSFSTSITTLHSSFSASHCSDCLTCITYLILPKASWVTGPVIA
jgi:hypothetical protein